MMGRISQLRTSQIVTVALVVLLCGIILYPLIQVFIGSFQTGGIWRGDRTWTLQNYEYAFTNARILRALWNTLVTSVLASVLALLIGVPLAWSCVRTDMPGRRFFEVANLIPFFLSPLVGAIAWRALTAPFSGLLNQLAAYLFGVNPRAFLNIYGIEGVVFVMALFYVPFVYISTSGVLQRMDPAMEEAARVSGAGFLRSVKDITLPLITPSLLFAWGLVFIMSAGMFNVPAVLGLPVGFETLATQIYEVVRRYPGDQNLGAALSSQLLLLALIIIWVQRKVIATRERRFVTVTGKGYRPRRDSVGRVKYVLLALNIAYFLVAVVLPVAALVVISFSRLGTVVGDTFSTIQYERVTGYPLVLRAVRNSLILAGGTATVGVLLSIAVSYFLYRTKARGRAVVDFVTSLPIAISGIIIGMGTLLGYITTPLYGTLTLVGIAYLSRFIPMGLKNVSAALLSTHPELEESARVSGASWMTTMRTIVVPLLAPGMIAAWLIMFIVLFKELNTSILLIGSGTEVTAYALYWLLQEKLMPTTAAFAVIESAIILVAVLIFRSVVGLRKLTL